MKCSDVEKKIGSLIDSEVASIEKRELEVHLSECESCGADYSSLKEVSLMLQQTLPISAANSLDKKVMGAFQSFHNEKQPVQAKEKAGWFGIPKLAFAAAFLLLALFSGSAFQLGRFSANSVEIALPVNNQIFLDSSDEKSSDKKSLSAEETRTQPRENVDVPVIKEKIIRVPIIREKIVTRVVYIDKNRKKERINLPLVSKQNYVALSSSIEDGDYLTKTNLKDFQPVSEIEATVTKKDQNK